MLSKVAKALHRNKTKYNFFFFGGGECFNVCIDPSWIICTKFQCFKPFNYQTMEITDKPEENWEKYFSSREKEFDRV